MAKNQSLLLKKILPKSLYGRFLLIIIASFAIVQFVSIYVFYYTHLDLVSKHMSRGIIEEMIFIKKSINKSGYTNLLQDLSENTGLNFSFAEKKRIKKSRKIADSSTAPSTFREYINPLIDPYNRFKIELENYKLTPFEIFDNPEDKNFIIVNLQTNQGIIIFEVPIKRITSSTSSIFIFWMVFTSILMMIIATLFFKNQVKSLKKLTIAAEKFGRGQEFEEISPSGSEEIQSLTSSFLEMKNRVKKQIIQRTETLSAVSHDLRTPLTRMKLQLALMNKNENQNEIIELEQNINDMQQLVEEYLDFARSDNQEKGSEIAIEDFIKNEIIEYYQKINQKIGLELELPRGCKIIIKRITLKRVLMNLIDNGLKYGENVFVKCFIDQNQENEKALRIDIEDNGSGIPESEQENVFKPFYRIDNARNLDSKNNIKKSSGSGLGMAIALDGISLHGGVIKLSKSKFGGLKVMISLPF